MSVHAHTSQTPEKPLPLEIFRANQFDVGVAWSDGRRSVHAARKLRLACPCAGCVNEVTGVKTLRDEDVPQDVRPDGIEPVGRYAIVIKWSDGHETGIYTFERLRRLEDEGTTRLDANGAAANGHGHSHEGHSDDGHGHSHEGHSHEGHAHEGHSHEGHGHAHEGHSHEGHGHAHEGHSHAPANGSAQRGLRSSIGGADRGAAPAATGPLAALTAQSPMRDVIAAFPGAQRALFRRYHIGGCNSCGFEPHETLADVCGRKMVDSDEVLAFLGETAELDRNMEVSVRQLVDLRKGGTAMRLLDVRTDAEWDIARIDGGELITEELVDEMKTWPKETLMIFYCHHGVRSLDAAAYFAGHGFKNVRSLTGGIDAWSREIDTAVPRY